MRLEDRSGIPVLVLSRRNLLSLLQKLDMPDSTRTLAEQDNKFLVIAEDDDAHYAHESREGAPPGKVHPLTEAYIKVVSEKN